MYNRGAERAAQQALFGSREAAIHSFVGFAELVEEGPDGKAKHTMYLLRGWLNLGQQVKQA